MKVLSDPTFRFSLPIGITSDSHHVWVTNQVGDSVTEMDASTGARVAVIAGARYRFDGPDAISSDGVHVWVTSYKNNAVTELDASTGKLGQGDFQAPIRASTTPGLFRQTVHTRGWQIWPANRLPISLHPTEPRR